MRMVGQCSTSRRRVRRRETSAVPVPPLGRGPECGTAALGAGASATDRSQGIRSSFLPKEATARRENVKITHFSLAVFRHLSLAARPPDRPMEPCIQP